MKFGGTSVVTKKGIDTIIKVVKDNLDKDPIVVVSALSGITDLLLNFSDLPKAQYQKNINKIRLIHKELVKKVINDRKTQLLVFKYIEDQLSELSNLLREKLQTKAYLDKLVSFGEILSSKIISEALIDMGIFAKQVLASDLIVTDDNFTAAEFLPIPTQKKVKKVLIPLIANRIVPVVTGFIAATKKGETTTLGRGGSDYTASILGFALNANEVQIWTDVDGMFTTDPGVVQQARLISQISYREASELAYFGARVLHPQTIRPAIQKNISVRVLNTFNPDSSGTLITQKSTGTQGLKAIAFKRKTTLINIYSTEMLFSKGYLAKVFEIFARYNISIELVSVSEVSISVTLDENTRISEAVKELGKFAQVSIDNTVGLISLVGENLIDHSHVLTDISSLFHSNKMHIKMISFGASNINISLVTDTLNIEKAVKLLHDKLLLSGTNSFNTGVKA